MARHRFLISPTFSAIFWLLVFVAIPGCLVGEPSPQAISGFNDHVSVVEARLAQQHLSQSDFLASASPQDDMRLRRRELIVEQLMPAAEADLPGAMLHDWRGTAFVPGAKAKDFERLMRDFNAYPQLFSPQVLQASVLTRNGDRFQVRMRVCQRHIITVVMNTTYDVIFGQLDANHGYSISRSTEVSEIESQGTANERTLNAGEEHGFLWRMNTYWTYEERDGGLYLQIESVSLTRSIPNGLGWAVRPFVESVPRESMEFTLCSIRRALQK